MADANSQDVDAKRLPAPTQCVLWDKPELVAPANERFDVVEMLADTSHFSRGLLKCRECGKLYFWEFRETVDWDDGDDAQYQTYIPVTAPEEIAALKQTLGIEFPRYTPRLQRDFPKGAKVPTVRWIGK
jgi:hypothetical protein